MYEGIESLLIKIISTDWLIEAFNDNEFKNFSKECLEYLDFDETTLNVIFEHSSV